MTDIVIQFPINDITQKSAVKFCTGYLKLMDDRLCQIYTWKSLWFHRKLWKHYIQKGFGDIEKISKVSPDILNYLERWKDHLCENVVPN